MIQWYEATPAGVSHNNALNLTTKPEDTSATLRVMPYDGKPADIGAPDLKAGKGCKEQKK